MTRSPTSSPRVDWWRRARAWRYVATDGRDQRIDALRGAAVCAMIVDHVGGPSFLYLLAGANTFFVSPAEAFVFIAGLMVGLVYGERARSRGLAGVTTHLLQRAWTLYLSAVWLTIGAALLTTLARLPEAPPAFASQPGRFILAVLTLQRTIIYVDVLLVFLFALLLAPLALALVQRGAGWLVLLLSGGLWASAQVLPAARGLPWPIADNTVFLFATWQIVFFAGLLIGHGRRRLGAVAVGGRWGALSGLGLALLGLALWGLMVGLHLRRETLDSGLAGLLATWFDKSTLPAPRLAASAVVFGAAWVLTTHLWRPFQAGLGWLLVPLGQRALVAYAIHIGLVLVVHGVWGVGQGGTGTLWRGVGSLIQVAVVLAVWGLARGQWLPRLVRPLGGPPVGPGGGWWRPGRGLLLLLLLAAAGAGLAATWG